MAQFVHSSLIDAPAEEVYAWHARPGALERLNTPWAPLEVLHRSGGIEDGARVTLALHLGPARLRWVVEHVDVRPGEQWRDVQLEGPFARWEHTHRFEPTGPQTCRAEDRIEFRLPLGPVGGWLGRARLERALRRAFTYRHTVLADDLAAYRAFAERPPLRVLLSGSHGLIGSALKAFLTAGGHRVDVLVRTAARHEGQVAWDPAGPLDPAALDGYDAVIHLAGENILGRWSEAKKQRIRDSRVCGTRRLAEAVAAAEQPPRAFLCASAVGLYGDRGAEVLDEASGVGEGFLAEVCREWEAAAYAAAGVRVAALRFGVVLTPAGGALARMLPAFRAGLGGPVGGGRQYVSWVAMDDALYAIHRALMDERLAGPINVVSPHPVTNYELARTLARVLGRPAMLRVPAKALRLAFGEAAEEMLLASCRAVPGRLTAAGFAFRFGRLEDALRHLLGRVKPGGSASQPVDQSTGDLPGRQ